MLGLGINLDLNFEAGIFSDGALAGSRFTDRSRADTSEVDDLKDELQAARAEIEALRAQVEKQAFVAPTAAQSPPPTPEKQDEMPNASFDEWKELYNALEDDTIDFAAMEDSLPESPESSSDNESNASEEEDIVLKAEPERKNAQQMAPKRLKAKKRCIFFNSKGGCRKGKACPFLHSVHRNRRTDDADSTPSSSAASTSSGENAPINVRKVADSDRTKVKKARSKGRPLCSFFNSAAGCRNGDSCPFLHVEKRSISIKESKEKYRKPTRPCWHFNSGNGCSYGDKCTFRTKGLLMWSMVPNCDEFFTCARSRHIARDGQVEK